jgi:hypothetical protein
MRVIECSFPNSAMAQSDTPVLPQTRDSLKRSKVSSARARGKNPKIRAAIPGQYRSELRCEKRIHEAYSGYSHLFGIPKIWWLLKWRHPELRPDFRAYGGAPCRPPADAGRHSYRIAGSSSFPPTLAASPSLLRRSFLLVKASREIRRLGSACVCAKASPRLIVRPGVSRASRSLISAVSLDPIVMCCQQAIFVPRRSGLAVAATNDVVVDAILRTGD